MIANRSQLILLRRDDLTIFALDFPRRATVFAEPTRDHDAVAKLFGLVRFVALVLESDRHLGHSVFLGGV